MNEDMRKQSDRRKFLTGALGAAAGAAALPVAARAEGKSDPLITEVQDWNKFLGDGFMESACPFECSRSRRACASGPSDGAGQAVVNR